MKPKLNGAQAIVALLVLVTVPMVLVLTGHQADMGFVTAGFGMLLLTFLRVTKGADDP